MSKKKTTNELGRELVLACESMARNGTLSVASVCHAAQNRPEVLKAAHDSVAKQWNEEVDSGGNQYGYHTDAETMSRTRGILHVLKLAHGRAVRNPGVGGQRAQLLE